MILLFTAIILYLLYLFLEHRQNEAARRSFLHGRRTPGKI